MEDYKCTECKVLKPFEKTKVIHFKIVCSDCFNGWEECFSCHELAPEVFTCETGYGRVIDQCQSCIDEIPSEYVKQGYDYV